MPGSIPPHEEDGPGRKPVTAGLQVLALHEETLAVSKRVRTTLVQATRTTRTRDASVEEDLLREEVTVERVPVGRTVEEAPPVRQEGDVTVVPVMVEELVVVRRLVLKEEVRIRRVRSTDHHVETVSLREQDVVVTRTPSGSDGDRPAPAGTMLNMGPLNTGRSRDMSEETIVAVFDTADHAQAARSALVGAGVPDSAISLHAGTAATTSATTVPTREPGFWSSLFGGDTDCDTAVYDRSLASGSTVVTVKVPGEQAARVLDILENHNPVNIDERAASYGLTTAAARPVAAASAAISSAASGQLAADRAVATAARTGEDTMRLSEERLTVGKRVVNRGGMRIRRYVVETPVEESVTLHDEKVVVERRPVTDGRPVGADEFSERTIEMTETAEEAVVSKTARVVEEVGLRKEATDRVQTVRDTVRKEEAEVTQVPGTETVTTRTGPVTTAGATGPAAVPPKR